MQFDRLKRREFIAVFSRPLVDDVLGLSRPIATVPSSDE
jgi:hypothetical protein